MNVILKIVLLALATAGPVYGQTVRVATFNVNYGNRAGDQVLDAIFKSKADIVCLQETTYQSERFLRDRLANVYPEFHTIGHQGKYFAERFAFVSKTPPRKLTFVEPSAGLFGFYLGTFSFKGGEVQIINVHLTPFAIPADAGFLRAMSSLAAIEDKHRVEIAAILQKATADVPTVVAGDFNSISTYCAPTAMVRAGFIDSFASVHPNADSQHTWHWPTRPLPLRLRIDYIFHSKHFRTVHSEILPRDGSDHYLMVSELKIGE